MYEGYGENYELVQRDIDESQRAISAWQDFDRAIEVLSAHVNPMRSKEANRKKAMTIKDLLIKVSLPRVKYSGRSLTSTSQYKDCHGTSCCSATYAS